MPSSRGVELTMFVSVTPVRPSDVNELCRRGNGEHTVVPRVKQLALRGEPLDPQRPARS